MYGLVSRGIKQFLIDGHGEEAWADICTRAGVRDEDFNIRKNYADGDVYALVEAASDMLGMSSDEVLVAFGRYWPSFAKNTRFGRLLTFGGNDFESLMRNLDHMHASIAQSLPGIRNPSFTVENAPDGALLVTYYSEREGLGSFVVGLLHGCAALFGQSVTVELLPPEQTSGRYMVRTVAAENQDAA